jgi:hypothetical protein
MQKKKSISFFTLLNVNSFAMIMANTDTDLWIVGKYQGQWSMQELKDIVKKAVEAGRVVRC